MKELKCEKCEFVVDFDENSPVSLAESEALLAEHFGQNHTYTQEEADGLGFYPLDRGKWCCADCGCDMESAEMADITTGRCYGCDCKRYNKQHYPK